MVNKIKDYLNNHPQDFARHIVTNLNGIPTANGCGYDASFVDSYSIARELNDKGIINIEDDWVDAVIEAVSEFYDNFKFIDVKVVDLLNHFYEIKYSFKGKEYSVTGYFDDAEEFVRI